MTVKITWQASDGYASGSRPQKATIPMDDLLDLDDEQEVREYIADTIQDDFEQKVSPSWSQQAEDTIVDKWREMKKEAGD